MTSVSVESPPTSTGVGHWLLSSDTHIIEPADLFSSRMSAKFLDDAPGLMVVDGVERWSAEGVALHPSTAAFAPGDRSLPPEQQRPRAQLFADAIEECAYVVSEWLAANERDGVYGGVVFPSSTLTHYGVRNTELLDEILRVYNEWMAEFAGEAPDRIKAVGLLNPDDVPRAVRSVEELSAQGFAGVMLPVRAEAGHTYDSPEFEPLWEAIEGHGLPLSMHIVAHRTPGDTSQILGSDMRLPDMVLTGDPHIRTSITDFILSGVFERHPNLRLLSVEHEGSWVFHFMQRLDWHYKYNRLFQDQYRLPDGWLPSDYIRRNVVICFTEDPFLVKNRQVLDVDNIAWGSDFPHSESLFSMSEASVAAQFAGVPEDERMKMAVGNTARLYGFDLPPRRA